MLVLEMKSVSRVGVFLSHLFIRFHEMKRRKEEREFYPRTPPIDDSHSFFWNRLAVSLGKFSLTRAHNSMNEKIMKENS